MVERRYPADFAKPEVALNIGIQDNVNTAASGNHVSGSMRIIQQRTGGKAADQAIQSAGVNQVFRSMCQICTVRFLTWKRRSMRSHRADYVNF
jgi:hypothetical protein